MQLRRFPIVYAFMKWRWALISVGFIAGNAVGQIQVDLKLPRLQYIAYEPVVATVTITNLAGRDVDFRDNSAHSWFGFEVTGSETQSVPQISKATTTPLTVAAGQQVTRKINLTPLYAVHDSGTYRVRAHIYLGDLNKYFYSTTRVFEVTDARPIWQKTVGVADEDAEAGNARTYSLMTNRFPDHTSLYVRVENKDSGMVFATYSLGQMIAFDQPQTEFDRSNQLHVLYCSAPRRWSYARVGLNGELVSRASFTEMKSRPRLVHSNDGVIKVAGGMMDPRVTQAARDTVLSARPANGPKDE